MEIVGTVTAEHHRADGSIARTLLGVEAVVPVGFPTHGVDLAHRPDEKSRDQPLSVTVLGRPLVIGGSVRSRPSTERTSTSTTPPRTPVEQIAEPSPVDLAGRPASRVCS